MKKAIIILAILLAATAADAMSSRPHKPDNWNILGSDDRQANHKVETYTGSTGGFQSVTNPVPEPATLLLLGAGLVGLAAWARRK